MNVSMVDVGITILHAQIGDEVAVHVTSTGRSYDRVGCGSSMMERQAWV